MNNTTIGTASPETIVWSSSAGIQQSSPISPNSWHGEGDCLVGPFSSREVAEYFAHPVVDFGHYDVCAKSIFVRRDSWYVEIESVNETQPFAEEVAL